MISETPAQRVQFLRLAEAPTTVSEHVLFLPETMSILWKLMLAGLDRYLY
jgi:hypothetical protein